MKGAQTKWSDLNIFSFFFAFSEDLMRAFHVNGKE